jgi:protein-tyrosine phosphatase
VVRIVMSLASLNFRDLGRLPLAGGLRVKTGLLYRGPGPARLGDAHRETLRTLGIRLVCDLRSEPERWDGMHACDAPTQFLRLDLPNDFADETSLGLRLLKRQPNAEGARMAMCASYSAMPERIRPHFPAFMEALCAGSVPALVHCTAGKDRTGVLMALLLLFLGVPEGAIFEEYLQSSYAGLAAQGNRAPTSPIGSLLRAIPDPGIVAALTGVDVSYLFAALDAVSREWRSIDGYFGSVGIGPTHRTKLLAILAESEGAQPRTVT